jgi:hypothetical protein
LKFLAYFWLHLYISSLVFVCKFGKGPKRLSTAAQLESVMTGSKKPFGKGKWPEPLDISENLRDDPLREARGWRRSVSQVGSRGEASA